MGIYSNLLMERRVNKETVLNGQRTYVRGCYSCGKKTIVIRSFGKRGDFIFICNKECFDRYIHILNWKEKPAENKVSAPFWNALVYRINQLEADLRMLNPEQPVYVEYRIRLDELLTIRDMKVSEDQSHGD